MEIIANKCLLKVLILIVAGWLAFLLPFSPAATASTETNIALNRAAYQSSALDYDNTAQMATDGLISTHWLSSSATSQWITIDLGQDCQIDKVVLNWDGGYPTVFSLQSSSDLTFNKTWSEIYEQINGTGGTIVIPLSPVYARYIKLVLSPNISIKTFSLSDFQIFGKKSHSFTAGVGPTLMSDGSLELTGGNWKVQNASLISESGSEISKKSFDDSSWLSATVPGTVLTSYLDDGAIPDPLFGEQVYEISNAFFTNNDFWYRDQFVIPTSYAAKHIWLNFEGINWKADVFVNGQSLGAINGAFIRSKFDLSSLVRAGQVCTLAVLVHKTDHPGPVKHKTLAYMPHNGGQLGLDSPTFVASQGWNWIPAIPGREVGIWNSVILSATGSVSIDDPFVTTSLPLPDTSHAALDIKVQLTNHADVAQNGILTAEIGPIVVSQKIEIAPNSSLPVEFGASNHPQLNIQSPRLWWPNGMGPQNLYHLHLHFDQSNSVSDSRSVAFGIRQFGYQLVKQNPEDKGIIWLYVNGKRILARGGNWGMDEAMLRYSAAQYDTAVRLHKEMNDNMIRVWIGMVAKDSFFDACDKYGLLVWNDFWIANPGDGPGPSDQTLFMSNAVDRIKAIRNHASLIIYCGRNEGYPAPSLDANLRQSVNDLDGSRYYLSSSIDPPVSGGGPYMLQTPSWYFSHATESLHTELGTLSVPSIETLEAMFPPDKLWPINDVWGLHDFCDDGYSHRAQLYIKMVNSEFGPAISAADFSRKAQMINMEESKAEAEANQAKQGSGMLLWMSHPAWPSLTCQTYDYYFDQTAGYFGTKIGNEPLHIFWNANTNEVEVANDQLLDTGPLTATAEIYDLLGKKQWSKSLAIEIPNQTCSECFPLELPDTLTGVYFIKLRLSGQNGLLSENFYWNSTTAGDYNALNTLAQTNLTVEQPVGTQFFDSTGDHLYKVSTTVTNQSSTVALEIRLKLVVGPANERILPAFYDDNYFSLLPGESRTIKVDFPAKQLSQKGPAHDLSVAVDGWNVVPQQKQIKWGTLATSLVK